ncbi:efflux RND transporter periplasmic adaptor subunit [Kangiella koreensis]|uniref:Efflux transporter, RND family, MFP subunit n=1 Tax=Kangiella koreensis (strain DSM 16069 / JCM 12317 / KCTC 12182 / SW-125) TaxID=523791 RepID=C7R8B4_KANKD|nr:efflux RND transporter periplasmic adaptor subunit [Kangiella koreensis]ACV27679.1 efflux transporter, RND family, MFP subunit [Kangiella koreensis DSM 16069]
MKYAVIISALLVTFTGNAMAADEAQQPVPVQVTKVTAGKTTLTENLPGRVLAIRTAEVRARVDGILEKRIFIEGQDVKKGQSLFQIDDRIMKANLAAAHADLNTAKAQQKLTKQTLKRYEQLLEQGAVSQQEFDTYQAQSLQADAQVEQAKAQLQKAQINLDYATVEAPISGRIGRALVTEGALVSASSATHLATIEQLDQVYVDFTRSATEINQLRELFANSEATDATSREVQILFADGTPYSHRGQLEFSSLSVDPDTGSVALRATVKNPDYQLLPGMFVRVKAPVADSSSLVQVPQKAVQLTGQGAVVKVIQNGKLAFQPVELGPMMGQNWVIKSGLKAGDQIITSNTQFLQPGTPVQAMSAPSNSSHTQQ